MPRLYLHSLLAPESFYNTRHIVPPARVETHHALAQSKHGLFQHRHRNYALYNYGHFEAVSCGTQLLFEKAKHVIPDLSLFRKLNGDVQIYGLPQLLLKSLPVIECIHSKVEERTINRCSIYNHMALIQDQRTRS